ARKTGPSRSKQRPSPQYLTGDTTLYQSRPYRASHPASESAARVASTGLRVCCCSTMACTAFGGYVWHARRSRSVCGAQVRERAGKVDGVSAAVSCSSGRRAILQHNATAEYRMALASDQRRAPGAQSYQYGATRREDPAAIRPECQRGGIDDLVAD